MKQKEKNTLSASDKLIKELKSIFWVSLYFLVWFGALMLIKVLLLAEYKIEFHGVSIVIVGALIAAKAVLILEHVPLGLKNKPVILQVLLRTFLYLVGVAVILILEKSIETSHEYGGFFNALKNLPEREDVYHIWVTIICVFGAMFFYNLGSVINDHIGKGGLWKILMSPVQK